MPTSNAVFTRPAAFVIIRVFTPRFLKTLTGNHNTTLETLRTDVNSKLAATTFNEYIADKSMSDTELKEYADNLVSPINTDVATLKTDVSNIKGATADIATIRSDVAANKTDVATLKTTINGDGTEGSGLVTKVAKLEQANVDHKAEYTALKGIVDGHSELLTGISDTTVKALIDDAKKAGTDAATAAEEAKGLVTTLENGKVATNTENIGKLDGRLTTVEDNVATLQGQIGGLTGAMHFRGTSTVDPMGENGPSIEGVESYASGDVVLYDGKEYIYDGSTWAIFGDEGSYALKATTLAGYGITDAYTKTEADAAITAAMSWKDME